VHSPSASIGASIIGARKFAANHLARSWAIVAHRWHQLVGLARPQDDWMLENAGPIVDLPR
jgi:hypothetical protein